MNVELYGIGLFIGVIIITLLVGVIVNRFFVRLIKRSTDEMMNDPTNYKFLRHAISGLVYVIGFSFAIFMVPSLRTLANSLLAGAGILAMAVGFASQQALSNIISGVFIVLFKPFRVNDRLRIGDRTGIVEDITLRHTVLKDFENKRIIIPNTVISNEVIVNADIKDERSCQWIEVGISYDSNIDLAKSIIVEEALRHPLQIDGRTEQQLASEDPEIVVRVIELGEYSINLRAWVWAKDSPDGFVMKCDLSESIKKRFDQKGIEIPFPYRNIVIKDKS